MLIQEWPSVTVLELYCNICVQRFVRHPLEFFVVIKRKKDLHGTILQVFLDCIVFFLNEKMDETKPGLKWKCNYFELDTGCIEYDMIWLISSTYRVSERRRDSKMNWSSLSGRMSSHNMIHKPRPRSWKEQTGFSSSSASSSSSFLFREK